MVLALLKYRCGRGLMKKFRRLIIDTYEMLLLTIFPLTKYLSWLGGGPWRTLVGHTVLARRLTTVRRIIVCHVIFRVFGFANSIAMAGAK